MIDYLLEYEYEDVTLCYQVILQRQAQMDSGHQLLLRHHQATKELELQQQTKILELRDEQTRKQHDTELANQREYTLRMQRELKQKHALEQKQMPKGIKVNGDS